MNPIFLKMLLIIGCMGVLFACSENDELDIDMEKPTIDLDYNEGFPKSCTQLVKGQTYQFRVQVMDNLALASYSLDIHHNFDHHTHDDQGEKCTFDPVKEPDNPMVYIQNFSIENRPKFYEISIPVTIPLHVDSGDYHCQYSITDQTGWQSRTSVDIKIVN